MKSSSLSSSTHEHRSISQLTTTTMQPPPTTTVSTSSSSWLPKWMLKPAIIAPEGYNRWRIPPIAIASHLCIGGIYAFSVINEPLSRSLGGIVSSSSDWALSQVVPIFSLSIVCLGFSAAVAGKWLEKVGPRAVGIVAASLWGGSWLIGSLGIHLHSLPLMYLQGVVGGCGLGLGYVAPVSTMLRWFEDKRGLAAGMAIVGFGGGSAIMSPIFTSLLELNFKPPKYLGIPEQLQLITDNGKRYCEFDGDLIEVVVATSNDIVKLGFGPELSAALQPGVYVVGTGDTGVATSFVTLGCVYTAIMLISAMSYRIPRPGWKPASATIDTSAPTITTTSLSSAAVSDPVFSPPTSPSPFLFDLPITSRSVDIDVALKTPQFYGLWMNLFLNVTSGIGIIAIAKTIMSDVFSATNPQVVDAQFCAGYVAAISIANLLGRIGWATLSDKIGRKRTFALFFGVGAPLFFSIPFVASWASISPEMFPLILFTSATLTCFSFYGGGFSTLPAFIADIFGSVHVGGIHGRMLTAWSMAGIAGPLTVTALRDVSTTRAINELVSKIDPDLFKQTYGASVDDLTTLVQEKSVTLANLMEIAPIGTIDPTPTLYASTFYVMGSLLGIGFINNLLIKPVDPKYYMTFEEEQVAKGKSTPGDDH